jgi:hypothetical protein
LNGKGIPLDESTQLGPSNVHPPEPGPSSSHSSEPCPFSSVPLTPEDIRHFPKAATRKWTLNDSKTRTTGILADRPVEEDLREKENSKQQVKESNGEQKAPL